MAKSFAPGLAQEARTAYVYAVFCLLPLLRAGSDSQNVDVADGRFLAPRAASGAHIGRRADSAAVHGRCNVGGRDNVWPAKHPIHANLRTWSASPGRILFLLPPISMQRQAQPVESTA
jgi:hypothetical protein